MNRMLRRVKVRAFTLIELLVVIAIIALLAAILTPAINKALLKGKLTQLTGNGKGIYQLIFAGELDNPLGLQSVKAAVQWPTSTGSNVYADASAYFNSLVTNQSLGMTYGNFAGPGIQTASRESEFLQGVNGRPTCAWCVTQDVNDSAPVTTPVLFTCNIKIANSGQLKTAGMGNQPAGFLLTEVNPLGKKGAVVVQRGGAAVGLDDATAYTNNFLAGIGTAETNTILRPAPTAYGAS